MTNFVLNSESESDQIETFVYRSHEFTEWIKCTRV